MAIPCGSSSSSSAFKYCGTVNKFFDRRTKLRSFQVLYPKNINYLHFERLLGYQAAEISSLLAIRLVLSRSSTCSLEFIEGRSLKQIIKVRNHLKNSSISLPPNELLSQFLHIESGVFFVFLPPILDNNNN